MYLDKDSILNSLTKEDVIKIAVELGSDYPKTDSQGNLIFKSVCHGSDSHKLYYYHEASGDYKGRMFKCYSKCGDSFNIVELVIRANRVRGKTVTWYRALKFIGQATNKLATSDPAESKQIDIISDFVWINRLKAAKRNQKEIPALSPVKEETLEVFSYAPHTEWLGDNISMEALSRYEIGYYGLTNQITIPHRDTNNRLIGIRGRYLDEADVERIGKYTPVQIGGKFLSHQLGANLYGISVSQDRIKRIKKAMLVESEKSCLQNYSYFGDDSYVLATCGSNITLTHQKLLLHYLKCEELLVAFDKEYHDPHSYEAEAYFNKLVKKVANIVPYCKVCFLLDSKNRLPYKASPTDMGKDVLMELLDEKLTITMDDVDRVLKKGLHCQRNLKNESGQ